MAKYWLIVLFSSLALLGGCVGHKNIDIPMSQVELDFYQSLDSNPLPIDSLSRNIHKMTFGEKKTIVYIDLSVRADTLKIADTDRIAKQVAEFNSTLVLKPDVKFDLCIVYIQNNTYGSASYRYKFKNRQYELIDVHF